MVLGDFVSRLQTFVWIWNYVSRPITWSLYLKSIKLGQMTTLNVMFHMVVSLAPVLCAVPD